MSQHPAAVRARLLRATPEAKAKAKKYRQDNREYFRNYGRTWTKKYRHANPEKTKEAARRWRLENPVASLKSVRKSRIKRKYRITVEDYEALLAKPCRICGRKAQGLDHDHEDDFIRDALCHNCNQGIGKFNDSPRLLRRAVLYLVYWNGVAGWPEGEEPVRRRIKAVKSGE